MQKEILFENIKLIKSLKLNSNQAISFFTGFTYQIILDKSLFPNNNDLKDFIYEIYLKPYSLEQYKDYVYANRTTLGSRVSRLILEKNSISFVMKQVEQISDVFEKIYKIEYNSKDVSSKSQDVIDGALDEWMNKLRENRNDR